MTHSRDFSQWSRVLKIADLSVFLVAFVLVVATPHIDPDAVSIGEFLSMRIKVQNILVFGGFMLAWYWTLRLFGLYRGDRVAGDRLREAADVIKADISASLLIYGLAHVIGIEFMSSRWLVTFFVATLVLLMAVRVALRFMLGGRAGLGMTHVLIVGTNGRAIDLARRMTASPELGYNLVGFVDETWHGEAVSPTQGYRVVTDFDGFQSFIKDRVVDEVVICTPVKSFYERSSRILSQCAEQGITVRFGSDIFDQGLKQSRMATVEGDLMVTVETGSMRGPGVIVKRLVDIVAAASLLLLLGPVLALIALAIKLTSPGPVMFSQDRVGLNKRVFKLHKFRTMIPDAEQRIADLESKNEVSGPVFKIKNDPRITPIGHFLRRTSLDELPQLFNVIKGDMSLVGPRPLPLRDYRGFTQDWHRRRVSVRPGITCLWQVEGRSAIPFEQWMELDMKYIDQWSLLLDLKILLKTIPAVLKGAGAS